MRLKGRLELAQEKAQKDRGGYTRGYLEKEELFGFFLFLRDTQIQLDKKNTGILTEIRDEINVILKRGAA